MGQQVSLDKVAHKMVVHEMDAHKMADLGRKDLENLKFALGHPDKWWYPK